MKWLIFLVVLALPTVSAYEEADASQVWRDLFGADLAVNISHEPELVREGDQFRTTLTLAAGHNVSSVDYQVCIPGVACIISPRPAVQLDGNTWQLDTAQFRNPLTGEPHTWLEGDIIGVQFFLNFTDAPGVHEYPATIPFDDPRCTDTVTCESFHYFTFNVAASSKETPWPLLALPVALTVVAWRHRAR